MLLQILSVAASFLIPQVFSLMPQGFDPSCQSHITHGYGYRLFFHLPTSSFLKDGSIQFNFSLTGPDNGHVLLAEKPNASPAYEIVLGAGGNEFSEIRKYADSKFKTSGSSLLTKNILSSDEIRNFTINIKSGMMTVINRNKQPWLTFLSWMDPSPLDVKYVSFCAWSEATVTWYYDCKGATLVPEKVSSAQKLKNKLLAKYDPYSIPVQDDNKLMIDTAIGIHYINLDAKKSLLTTHGKFNFTWLDYRMKWDPKRFDNITSINLLHREIWLPEFTLFNSMDSLSSPMGKSVTRVTYNGLVSWWPGAELETWCTLDLKEWPFDSQYCNISLGLYSHPEAVHVSLSRLEEGVTLKNLEWKIVSVTGKTTTIINPWESNKTDDRETHQVLMLNIELQRQSQIYISYFFVPIIGSIIIVIGCFWLPVFCVKRLFLHSVCFLLILLNLLSLDMSLPALPDSTPHIMSVSSGLLFMATVHIIFSSCLMGPVEMYRLIPPKTVVRVVTNPIIQRMFCLLMDSPSTDDVYSEFPEEDNINSRPINHSILFYIVLNKILFILSTLYILFLFIF